MRDGKFDGLPPELSAWADDLIDAMKTTPFDLGRAMAITRAFGVFKATFPRDRPELRLAAIEAAIAVAKHFQISSSAIKEARTIKPAKHRGLMSCAMAN